MAFNQTGIYGILHKKTGRVYIGQAANIRYRWSVHKANLNKGNHHCQFLQRVWDKHGAASLEWLVLEECELSQLNEREQAWMDAQPKLLLMNAHPTAGSARGYKIKQSTKDKIGAKAKLAAANPEERKRRSERAKAQHAAGKLGQATWPEAVKEDMRLFASELMKKHGHKGRAVYTGDSTEMSRRSYCRKLFKYERMRLGDGRAKRTYKGTP